MGVPTNAQRIGCSPSPWTCFQVRQVYLGVGRKMRAFEVMQYERWVESLEKTMPSLLERHVLVPKSFSTKEPATRVRSNSTASVEKDAWSPLDVRYKVDFDQKLMEIIVECRYMEKLGFDVPLVACSKALQVHYEP
ncbi:hypothetical protein V1264_021743 [Littorina saxatilis]|uniref:Dynein heavy chain tail domain-containing protein n=1 Tax=Littorina saxatilis TaxID=31220 RepID=A0AAN9AIT0_9CAEN